MNLKIGTAAKALAILVGLVLGSDVISETKMDQIVGAVTVLGAVVWDVWETYRLHKQGIVSTTPQKNVDAPGSPHQLAAEERKKEETL
jgi:hypothetical protein